MTDTTNRFNLMSESAFNTEMDAVCDKLQQIADKLPGAPEIEVFSYDADGLVPGPAPTAEPELRYLRADGTWVTIVVPTRTSELTNDTNFQSRDDVQELIDDAVADIVGFKGVVVTELPESGEPGIIYLLPNEHGSHDEYMWIEGDPTGHFEQIGSTDVDLTNYYTKAEIDTKIADKEPLKVTITQSGSTYTTDYSTAEIYAAWVEGRYVYAQFGHNFLTLGTQPTTSACLFKTTGNGTIYTQFGVTGNTATRTERNIISSDGTAAQNTITSTLHLGYTPTTGTEAVNKEYVDDAIESSIYMLDSRYTDVPVHPGRTRVVFSFDQLATGERLEGYTICGLVKVTVNFANGTSDSDKSAIAVQGVQTEGGSTRVALSIVNSSNSVITLLSFGVTVQVSNVVEVAGSTVVQCFPIRFNKGVIDIADTAHGDITVSGGFGNMTIPGTNTAFPDETYIYSVQPGATIKVFVGVNADGHTPDWWRGKLQLEGVGDTVSTARAGSNNTCNLSTTFVADPANTECVYNIRV